MLTRFHADNWHPLTCLSHAVVYHLWGLNPRMHHFIEHYHTYLQYGTVFSAGYTTHVSLDDNLLYNISSFQYQIGIIGIT